MINRNYLHLVICIYIIACIAPTNAYSTISSPPLDQSIRKADLIVIAQLVNYSYDPHPKVDINSDEISAAIEMHQVIQRAGNYDLKVIKTIKGSSPEEISVRLPTMVVYEYNMTSFPITPGKMYLLILSETRSSEYSPIDIQRPILPLPDNIDKLPTSSNPELQVLQIILSSLTHPTLRSVNITALEQIVNPLIIFGLVPYLEDPNENTQNAVLTCLASNQQVATIPRIVNLDRKFETQGDMASSVLQLGYFNTPAAIPYLNPLLWNSDYYIRLNTIQAYGKIGDASSIPYLILALRDPDPQHLIPSGAWGKLHDLIPSLGSKYADNRNFYLYRDQETQPIYNWWSDELLGKHITASNPYTVPQTIPDTPALLDTLLFVPDTATRRAAIAKLKTRANTDSIPYLILALQDPDNQQPDVNVAYSAYKILHRLIPSLGLIVSSDAFSTDPAGESTPEYAWWKQKLLGKLAPPAAD